MMKHNSGFTLVELLAVIVILGSISLVTVMGITASLERRDVKECEEQVELVKNAAKIYFSLQETGPKNGDTVRVDTLVEAGYIDDIKTKRLKNDDMIKINNNEYEYTGNCQ